MNDSELDDLLNTWTAPPAPPSLRDRVRSGFTARPPRRAGWIGSLAAAAVLGGIAFFLIVGRASPQVPPAPIPWTVDSEFIRYADDGTSSIEMYSTAYQSNGNEILVSRYVPGDPFKTALGRAWDVTGPALSRFHMHVLGAINPGFVERIDERMRSRPPSVGFISGCDSDACVMLGHYFFAKSATGCMAGTIVGRETILNYAAEAVRQRWTEHGRMTVWMAPGLGCFALKVTYEEERPDGTFRLVSAKQAVKVTLNPVK